MELISALIGVLLLYYLQDLLYKRYWKKNLAVNLEFSKDSAIEGEELSLVEIITNRKLLPLPILQVKFMASRHLEFKDTNNSTVSDHYYRNDMLSVMMYQKLTRTLAIRCPQRGYYTITRMDIVCSNLFMTHEEVETYNIDICFYVYPKSIDMIKFDIAFSKMLGTVLTRRFINEDPFEFHNIREYQSYDNLKAINWKASAKTDSLKVNVHDYTSSQQVQILINTESESIWKYDDLNEESIRIASSLAQIFIGQGIPVAMYTNARDVITKETLEVPAGSGSNHYRVIQESLARIDLTVSPLAFTQHFHDRLISTSSKDFMIIISYYQKGDLQQLMLNQMNARKEFVWIIPRNQEIQVTVRDELASRIIPWEIEM
ncbi:MAG TPA: DUF58 domain-containing protein [Mobilitalea sp.]|nr:DUF58 domain-containing protein [Mobilitalea sp.]